MASPNPSPTNERANQASRRPSIPSLPPHLTSKWRNETLGLRDASGERGKRIRRDATTAQVPSRAWLPAPSQFADGDNYGIPQETISSRTWLSQVACCLLCLGRCHLTLIHPSTLARLPANQPTVEGHVCGVVRAFPRSPMHSDSSITGKGVPRLHPAGCRACRVCRIAAWHGTQASRAGGAKTWQDGLVALLSGIRSGGEGCRAARLAKIIHSTLWDMRHGGEALKRASVKNGA